MATFVAICSFLYGVVSFLNKIWPDRVESEQTAITQEQQIKNEAVRWWIKTNTSSSSGGPTIK